jgi:hypothetical protein
MTKAVLGRRNRTLEDRSFLVNPRRKRLTLTMSNTATMPLPRPYVLTAETLAPDMQEFSGVLYIPDPDEE